ncbi:hypothetical protein HanRHA438_Chr10g0477991 [Helianthus annuus]|uniref:Uncharacterized protein n=1 Tax=Helianthus annuus TaxID=4232 RepID=A0A251TQL8_HELAN|nr:hypothetical protein HanXRQr2_Chr10g0464221 [Helianthus annuus]KAJ0515496.1 hypothetical protein HanHA300_Chr10g0381141 [Helianthus annuus]KAJ0531677.1 hypothetical protein HanHA89_Chr10g0403591 [Helianthus annuus]KAJ0745433.1 hypothetical protein HanPI659440_Chr10g0398581 [Helianthus annuus]KAJ0881652.1 hypothetical protein HanRHA438_Chr10g0476521 [Helianthus annuus]
MHLTVNSFNIIKMFGKILMVAFHFTTHKTVPHHHRQALNRRPFRSNPSNHQCQWK